MRSDADTRRGTGKERGFVQIRFLFIIQSTFNMKQVDIKKVLGLLGFILRCPICHYRYNLETMQVVETDQNEVSGQGRILIHSDCQKCQGSVMFSIGVAGPELVSAASVTDLTLSDTHKFRAVPPLTTDDVLQVHTAVKRFKGDLIKAIKKTL